MIRSEFFYVNFKEAFFLINSFIIIYPKKNPDYHRSACDELIWDGSRLVITIAIERLRIK